MICKVYILLATIGQRLATLQCIDIIRSSIKELILTDLRMYASTSFIMGEITTSASFSFL